MSEHDSRTQTATTAARPSAGVGLVPYAFEGQPMRTGYTAGEWWFIAADVCRILDISNPSQALARLDDDEKGLISTETPGGEQQVRAVTEAGLYSLILGARSSEKKPQARKFKRWVTHEVLPAIRQTGGYTAPAVTIPEPRLPASYADALRELATTVEDRDAEHAARQVAEGKVAELAPKAEAANALLDADGSLPMGALANIFGVGRTRLFRILRAERILQVDRRPYQPYADWFRTVATTHANRDGTILVDHTSYIYGHGALRLHSLLTRRGYSLNRPQEMLALTP